MTRHAPKDETTFQLFPFLAVLLCSMGALILLLVVITRCAGERDKEQAKAAAEVHDELKVKLSTAEFRNEQYKISRDKSAEQLAEERLALSHLEDHARRIRDEIATVEKELELLAKGSDKDANLAELRKKLAEAEARIRSKTESLEKAVKDAKFKKPSFAIIPHTGPNQTRRRPLYIECLADRVVLQPEGIVLRESDFMGVMGPGNPLASALRAGREFLVRSVRYGTEESDGEPYPLLLVRPSGIGAYYAARDAMTTWGAEFGYEFVEEDWQLKFLPPDDGLALVMNRAVEEARRRQMALAMAAPRLITAQERMAFAQGGVAPAGGGAFDIGRGQGGSSGGGKGLANAGSTRSGQNGSGGKFGGLPTSREGTGGGTGYGEGGGGYGGNGNIPHASSRATSDDLAQIYGGVMSGGASGGTGGPSAQPGRGAGNAEVAMQGASGPGGGNDPNGTPGSMPGRERGNASGTRGPDNGGKQQGDGSGSGQGEGPSQRSSSGSGNGSSGSRGSNSSSATGSGSSQGSSQSGGSAAPSALTMGEQVQTYSAVQDNSKPNLPQSLTLDRGANWALPPESRAPSMVLVTRPVQIECHADRLVLRNERGDPRADKIVPIEGNTVAAVDTLIIHIWKHIESWGIAGRNMGWRPILVVHTSPDGRGRFDELRELLAGSGLEIRESTSPAAVATPATNINPRNNYTFAPVTP